MSISAQDQLADRLIALDADNKQLRENAQKLLREVGQPSYCRGCREKVWVVYHARDRHNQIYDPDAGLHNCPNRAETLRAFEEGR
jgi:hypothetical protein